MQATRNALFAFALIVSLAAVACQPTDELALVEPGARTAHPVIQVPAGPTMLPPAPAAPVAQPEPPAAKTAQAATPRP